MALVLRVMTVKAGLQRCMNVNLAPGWKGVILCLLVPMKTLDELPIMIHDSTQILREGTMNMKEGKMKKHQKVKRMRGTHIVMSQLTLTLILILTFWIMNQRKEKKSQYR